MTPRRLRHWIMLCALLAAIVYWSEFSDWSPVNGWVGKGIESWRVARIRSSAVPPCASESWSGLELALGVKLEHPECYDAVVSEARDTAFVMDSDASAMPIIVRVGALSPQVMQSTQDPLEGWQSGDLTGIDSCNGWSVYSYRGGVWTMGLDYNSYEYVLLGRSRVIVVGADLLEILEASEVERALLDTLESLVERLCADNNGELIIPAESDSLDTQNLRFWIGNMKIMQFQFKLVMQSE